MRSVNRRLIIVLVVLAALVPAGVLIAVSLAGGGDGGSQQTGTVAPAPNALFAGIPQHGTVLGKPSAPATVLEFADLQCPYCAQYSREILPSVIRDFVRTGRVKLDYRPLAFIGPDSDVGARAVLAAAKQNRAWNLLDGLFDAQGGENDGWLSEDLIREVAGSVPGLDVDRLLKDMKGMTPRLQQIAMQASALGVRGTPSFYVVRPPSAPQQLQLSSLDEPAFRTALESLLA